MQFLIGALMVVLTFLLVCMIREKAPKDLREDEALVSKDYVVMHRYLFRRILLDPKSGNELLMGADDAMEKGGVDCVMFKAKID